MQSLRALWTRGASSWVIASVAIIAILQNGAPANGQCFDREPVSGFSPGEHRRRGHRPDSGQPRTDRDLQSESRLRPHE